MTYLVKRTTKPRAATDGPRKPNPAPAKMTFTEAKAAIHAGKFVRCDDYMSPGWKIGRVEGGGDGLFNINPHTGSNYQFTPQRIDVESKNWRIVE